MAVSKLALITFMEGGEPVDPGYGMGVGGRPDQGLPSYGRPDNSLPSGGHIWLPVYPFDPTTGPDNTLPTPPVTVWPPRPGGKFVVKYLACQGLILVPDNELPEHAQPK